MLRESCSERAHERARVQAQVRPRKFPYFAQTKEYASYFRLANGGRLRLGIRMIGTIRNSIPEGAIWKLNG